MVISQLENKPPSTRLLKHIIKCYIRLTENQRASMALSQNMPEIIKEKRLIDNLDENSKKCLRTLCEVLESQQHKNLENSLQFEQIGFKNEHDMKKEESKGEFGVS